MYKTMAICKVRNIFGLATKIYIHNIKQRDMLGSIREKNRIKIKQNKHVAKHNQL